MMGPRRTSHTAAGTARYGDLPPGAIGVLEAPHRPMPVGMVFCMGWDGDGLAAWPLATHDAAMSGPWMKVQGLGAPDP
jgi:hypothetical protein